MKSTPQALIPADGPDDTLHESEPGLGISLVGGRVLLPRRRVGAALAARRKVEALGLTEDDVADALAWARKKV